MNRWRLLATFFCLTGLVASLLSCGPARNTVNAGAVSGIGGKVTRGGEPYGGAAVIAYATFEDYRADRAAARSGPTPAGGDFFLPLPPGRYHVIARDSRPVPSSAGLFMFHGSNPVKVAPGQVASIRIPLAPISSPPSRRDGGGQGGAGLEGVVTVDGEPLAGAAVYLYLDEESDFKGTAYAFSPPTGRDGRFSFSGRVEGPYYAVARKRAGGRMAGPIGPGDYYGFYPHNPIRLVDGEIAGVRIEVIEKAEELIEGEGEFAAAGTRIAGTIVDESGRPVAGAYAFVYSGRIMSHAKPTAFSRPTGAMGAFVIHLPRGGRYYLGARERYGLNPQPGERYGKYAGTPDHSISVDEGATRSDVTIVVETVLQ